MQFLMYEDTLSHAGLSVWRGGDHRCQGGLLSPPSQQSRSAPDIVSQTTLHQTTGEYSRYEIKKLPYILSVSVDVL